MFDRSFVQSSVRSNAGSNADPGSVNENRKTGLALSWTVCFVRIHSEFEPFGIRNHHLGVWNSHFTIWNHHLGIQNSSFEFRSRRLGIEKGYFRIQNAVWESETISYFRFPFCFSNLHTKCQTYEEKQRLERFRQAWHWLRNKRFGARESRFGVPEKLCHSSFKPTTNRIRSKTNWKLTENDRKWCRKESKTAPKTIENGAETKHLNSTRTARPPKGPGSSSRIQMLKSSDYLTPPPSREKKCNNNM